MENSCKNHSYDDFGVLFFRTDCFFLHIGLTKTMYGQNFYLFFNISIGRYYLWENTKTKVI